MTSVATSSVAITEKESTALYRGGFNRKAFDALFLNDDGRTDRKELVVTLLGVASKFNIEGDFDWISRKLSRKNSFATSAMSKQLRRRINEVIDSSVDLKVKAVRKSPKVTSGEVDLGKVIDTSGFATKEDLGLLGAKVDKLAEAMALIASAVAKS